MNGLQNMSQGLAEEDKFISWKELSIMISNDGFQYIDAEKYNEYISKLVEKMYYSIIDENMDINLSEHLLKKNKKREAFVCEVLEDMFFNSNYNYNLPFDVFPNLKIIEDALDTISIQLIYKDYEYPSSRGYLDM